jgi:hypothetical protein
VDYRITNSRTKRVLDDSSVKHLQVIYRPAEHGPRASLAYTGLARLPDGTATGTWIRETLRGESDVFDDSMRHLLARLNRDLARLRQPLLINVLVVQGDRRFFGGLSNIHKPFKVMPRFEYQLTELTKPLAFDRREEIHVVPGFARPDE